MHKLPFLIAAPLLFARSVALAATLEGTVQKIDPTKKEIVLNTESGSETVEVSGATKGAEKVKPGDGVKITYIKKGEKLEAVTIDRSKSTAPVSPFDPSAASRQSGDKLPVSKK